MKKLRVLLLMHEHLVPPDSMDGVPEKEANNWLMEFDVRAALRDLGHEVIQLGVGDELLPIRRAIEEHKPHVCCNLLTHFLDVGAYHAHVVSYLELQRAAYTGCNPRGLLLAGDKALSKKVLTYHRVRVPRFAVFRYGKAVRSARGLQFPLIVKSVAEQASMGIAQASVVRDFDALVERVAFVHRTIGTAAIAEQYIEGRELNVGVIGNERLTVLPVREVTFEAMPEGSAQILTAKGKWDLEYQKRIGLSAGPAQLDEPVQREIERQAKRIYKALSLTGYARIDLRLSQEDKPYVLEANPNPDVCRHEDFASAAAAAGIDYESLIQKIIALGISHRPAWKRG